MFSSLILAVEKKGKYVDISQATVQMPAVDRVCPSTFWPASPESSRSLRRILSGHPQTLLSEQNFEGQGEQCY